MTLDTTDLDGMSVDAKLSLIVTTLIEQNDVMNEILEKLANLSLPGSDFGVYSEGD